MTIRRLKRGALAIGAAGAAACVLGALLDRASFYRAWLLGFLFWSGIATSSAGLLMVHHLTGGGWGLVLRRPLRAAAGTLPALFLLFLPLLPGLPTLYPWAAKPGPYLNAPFFLLRAAICFVVWGALGAYLCRDRARARLVSGPGLLALVFTMTFASVDWAMSLEPRWYSTSYGLLFIGGQALSTLVLGILLAGLFPGGLPSARIHDLGNLTLTFLMLWAYLAFTQFLIIWSADLPEETSWYLRRTSGGWNALALGLVLFHFAGPFAALLSVRVKRSARALAAVAGVLLLMRFVDLYWMVAPSLTAGGPRPHGLDLAAPGAIGGVWLAAVLHLAEREVAA
jgi:hypothetical protein